MSESTTGGSANTGSAVRALSEISHGDRGVSGGIREKIEAKKEEFHHWKEEHGRATHGTEDAPRGKLGELKEKFDAKKDHVEEKLERAFDKVVHKIEEHRTKGEGGAFKHEGQPAIKVVDVSHASRIEADDANSIKAITQKRLRGIAIAIDAQNVDEYDKDFVARNEAHIEAYNAAVNIMEEVEAEVEKQINGPDGKSLTSKQLKNIITKLVGDKSEKLGAEISEHINKYLAEDKELKHNLGKFYGKAVVGDVLGAGSIAFGIGMAVASHGAFLPLTIFKLAREGSELITNIAEQTKRTQKIIEEIRAAVRGVSDEYKQRKELAIKGTAAGILGLGEAATPGIAKVGELAEHVRANAGGLVVGYQKLAAVSIEILSIQESIDQYKPNHVRLNKAKKSILDHTKTIQERVLSFSIDHVTDWQSRKKTYIDSLSEITKDLAGHAEEKGKLVKMDDIRKRIESICSTMITLASGDLDGLLKDGLGGFAFKAIKEAVDVA